MKRFWIGASILCVLLLLGSLISWQMARIHAPIAQDLRQARQAAMAEDWQTAQQQVQQAHQRWQDHWHFTAAFADHTPMDELDGLFGELLIFSQQREMPHFAAICDHLAQLAEAMADSHCPSWWNLL